MERINESQCLKQAYLMVLEFIHDVPEPTRYWSDWDYKYYSSLQCGFEYLLNMFESALPWECPQDIIIEYINKMDALSKVNPENCEAFDFAMEVGWMLQEDFNDCNCHDYPNDG